jgi:hypothetical protein
VFLPSAPASIRVAVVNGVAVPRNPTGGFDPADVPIDAGGSATVMIEARNVPLNADVKLHLFSENGADLQEPVQLTGTLASSEGTVDVLIPIGFSRAFVRAAWTNQ